MLSGKSRYSLIPFLYITLLVLVFHAHADNVHKKHIINHSIEIELFLKDHRLKAVDHILVRCADAEKILFSLNKAFQILSVTVTDRKLDFRTHNNLSGWDETVRDGFFGEPAQRLEITLPPDLRQADALTLDVTYEGRLYQKPGSLDLEDVGETAGTLGEEGVYLSPACLWYPDEPNSLAAFSVACTTPDGYEAVTQGGLLSRKSLDGKTVAVWSENSVAEGCHLVAGRYAVTQVDHNGIAVCAYFFPEEQGLVQTYLNAATRYLDMYQKLLGEYPYKKFAIVENFFQTGYGMPSFTLLGSSVVKLPFIVDTSLGHEILHNWWGNSVFVDESQGNWCEGLTTYLADYYYKELKDAASAEDYRKDICRKYTSYVTEQNDLPLKNFISRRDDATRAVGYGKTAMVFHMLRLMAGDEAFYASLRKFYRENVWRFAGWGDVRHAFEETCKKDLSWFFGQWVGQAGAPFLELGKTVVEKTGNGWETKAEVIQSSPQKTSQECKPYRLSVPIRLDLDDGTTHTAIAELTATSNAVSIPTKAQPRRIGIDPFCDVFRRLHREEIPPTIDLVLGDPEKIIVYPTGGEPPSQAAYKRLAEFIRRKKGMVKADMEVSEAELSQNSLFILGGPEENKLAKKLAGCLPENFLIKENSFIANKTAYSNKDNTILITAKNPKNTNAGIAFFYSLSPDTIESTGNKIHHYGKYGYLVFEGAKNVDKGVFSVADTPLQRRL